ncbi:hypothetical protein HF292_009820 [Acidithiobacillus ferruginosus]|jgi:hypothetical protein|uniref:Uncharacterized protein n=1 Tax=Acidithiobacillus ferruginosus TaxID=3063951 RepID=A0ACD5IE56_9PROT|nr:hypothetical protein [Acidithiobacillus ferruginosus]MBU2814594.1 hypothetical protein [Acidithiobacillus ferruginosus]
MKKEFLVTPILFVLLLSGCAESKPNNPLKLPPDCPANKSCVASALENTGILFTFSAGLPEDSIKFSSVRQFWTGQENSNSLLWRQVENICDDMERGKPMDGLTTKQEANVSLGCQAVNLI